MNAQALKVSLNVSAMLTGFFSILLMYMFWSSSEWIQGVKSQFSRHDTKIENLEQKDHSLSERQAILEQQLSYTNSTLKEMNRKIDILIESRVRK